MAKPINVTGTSVPLGNELPTEPDIQIKKPFELSNNYVPEQNFQGFVPGQPIGINESEKYTRRINDNANILQETNIVLTGRYPENKLNFPKFDLSKIEPREDVNFNFILRVIGPLDGKQKVFTSQKIYDYLMDAYQRNIPFPQLPYLSEVVQLNLRPILEKVEELNKLDSAFGVFVENNIMAVSEISGSVTSINYDNLLKYVDWVVSKPGLNYDERLIPVQEISSFTPIIEEDEPSTGETETAEENTTNNNEGNTSNSTGDPEPLGNPSNNNSSGNSGNSGGGGGSFSENLPGRS